MAKRIICKNEDGVQVEFNYSFEPFFLVSVDGIYTVWCGIKKVDSLFSRIP